MEEVSHQPVISAALEIERDPRRLSWDVFEGDRAVDTIPLRWFWTDGPYIYFREKIEGKFVSISLAELV